METPIVYVSKSKFKELLAKNRSANFITFTSLTVPNLKPKFKELDIKKISIINGTIAANYQKAVRKVTKNPKFRAKPRAWGVRKGTLVYFKKKSYLPIHIKSKKELFRIFKNKKFKLVTKSKVSRYLKESNENPVRYRNFDTSNIVRAQFNKRDYIIKS